MMKTNVMKVLLSCGLVITSFSGYGQLSRTEADQMVLDSILHTISMVPKTCDVFCQTETLKSTGQLTLFDHTVLNNPFAESYVYFIDDRPFANWFHPCRYVFVDKATGNYSIINQSIYPATWETGYDTVAAMQRPTPKPVGAGKSTQKSVTIATPNNNLYAVIINGTDYTRYWNDISALYTTLIKVYGYTKEHIFVLYDDGYSNQQYGNDFDGLPFSNDIDYPAHKYEIERTFRNLSGEWTNDPNVPAIGSNDQLFIYVTDHGYTENNHSYIYLNSDSPNRIWDYDFVDYIKNIPCAHILTVMEQCYSGGFVLPYHYSESAACRNREIHTAASADEGSWYESYITNRAFDEFVFYWTAAARGFYPDLSEPWNDWAETGNFDFSPYFSSHPSDYNPDLNSDGIVQMGEAFAYADDFDSYSPNGFYYSNNSNTYEHPMSDRIIEFGTDMYTLKGLNGIVNSNKTISRNYLIGGLLTLNSGVTLTLNGCNLYLGNEGVFKVNGTILESQDKTTTISGPGYTYLNGAINANSGSSLTFTGVGTSTKMVEVNAAVTFSSNLTSVSFTNGKIVMNNSTSRMKFDGPTSTVSFNNILVTSATGSYLGNSGITIYNVPNITAQNSTFEYNKYGLYLMRTSNHPRAIIDNCTFRYCYDGLLVYNSGATVTNSNFLNNSDMGIYCLSMDQTSSYSNVTSSANTNYGMYYEGSSTSGYSMDYCGLSTNNYGIYTQGPLTADISCSSSVNNTNYGIMAYNNSYLDISGSDFQGNKIAIQGSGSATGNYNNNFALNNGYNDLRDNASIGSWCLYGNFRAILTSPVAANNNYWKNGGGAPVNNTDYLVYGSSGNQISITDNSPESTFALCNVPESLVEGTVLTSAGYTDAGVYMEIATSLGTQPLNEAVETILNENEKTGTVYDDNTRFELLSEVLNNSF